MQSFKTFRLSIVDAENQLENINNRRASLLVHLLEYNSIEFELWLLDIAKLDKENQKYLAQIISIAKEYLEKNENELKKFNSNQMTALNKVIETHEEYARKQQINLARIIELIRYEMNHRTFQVKSIAERLKTVKTSPALMKQISEEMRAALLFDSDKMKGIVSTFELCEISKITMENMLKKPKILQIILCNNNRNV